MRAPAVCDASSRALLATVLIAAWLAVVPAQVAEAQTITFPGGFPPADFRAEVEIAASPEQVWAVLTDFSAYPIWNPFIYPIKGQARVGDTLGITIHPGTGSLEYRATVVAAQINRELAWSGRDGPLGVFDTTYRFTIEPVRTGRARLVVRETHTPLAGVLVAALVHGIQSGLSTMIKAARNRAELERVRPAGR